MPSPSRFLSRRWLLAFLGIAALLFGLAMLHPYPRQSLFGHSRFVMARIDALC